MADHILNIVVNRTRETGRWVAEVVVDDRKRTTTLVFSQRKHGFSPFRWISEIFRGVKNAESLSKKYLRALNMASDHAFGRKPGFTHIRKPITQRSIDNKFSVAAKALSAHNGVNGPVGAPFASYTEDFSQINVTVNDAVEQAPKTKETISAIFDEVEALGERLSESSKKYYYPQLDLALHVANAIRHPEDSNESELRTAVGLVKYFSDKLKSSGNKKLLDELANLQAAVENRLDTYRQTRPEVEPTKVQLSAPSVYGKRPARPEKLGPIEPRKTRGE